MKNVWKEIEQPTRDLAAMEPGLPLRSGSRAGRRARDPSLALISNKMRLIIWGNIAERIRMITEGNSNQVLDVLDWMKKDGR